MDGAEPEEGSNQEVDVTTARSMLESFTESQEVRELIGNLRGAFGDLVTREMATEKFIGKHSIQRERVRMSLKGAGYPKMTKIPILEYR